MSCFLKLSAASNGFSRGSPLGSCAGVLRPWRRPCAVSWWRSWRCRCLRPWRDLMDGWVDFGGSLGWIERLPDSWPPFWGQVGAMLGEVGVIWSICQGDVRAVCSQKRDARKHCKIPGWQGSAHSIVLVPCLGTCWGHVGPAWTMLGPCCGGPSQGSKARGRLARATADGRIFSKLHFENKK